MKLEEGGGVFLCFFVCVSSRKESENVTHRAGGRHGDRQEKRESVMALYKP